MAVPLNSLIRTSLTASVWCVRPLQLCTVHATRGINTVVRTINSSIGRMGIATLMMNRCRPRPRGRRRGKNRTGCHPGGLSRLTRGRRRRGGSRRVTRTVTRVRMTAPTRIIVMTATTVRRSRKRPRNPRGRTKSRRSLPVTAAHLLEFILENLRMMGSRLLLERGPLLHTTRTY